MVDHHLVAGGRRLGEPAQIDGLFDGILTGVGLSSGVLPEAHGLILDVVRDIVVAAPVLPVVNAQITGDVVAVF